MNNNPALQDASDVISPARDRPDRISSSAATPDTLLECLLVVVHAHGGTLSRQGAIDGLPLVDNRLTPSLFRRAAKRAGFTSNVVRKPLDGLNTALFPAVLLLNDDEACVLLGWQDDGRTARLVFPELGKAEALLPRDELAARYAGFAIFARPEFRFDARTPEVGRVRQRHWFWGTLAENKPLFPRYRGYYAKSFTPEDGRSLEQWASEQALGLGKPGDITVGISDLKVDTTAPDKAITEFSQSYASPDYRDVTPKRMEWVREGNRWKIQREQVLTTPETTVPQLIKPRSKKKRVNKPRKNCNCN